MGICNPLLEIILGAAAPRITLPHYKCGYSFPPHCKCGGTNRVLFPRREMLVERNDRLNPLVEMVKAIILVG